MSQLVARHWRPDPRRGALLLFGTMALLGCSSDETAPSLPPATTATATATNTSTTATTPLSSTSSTTRTSPSTTTTAASTAVIRGDLTAAELASELIAVEHAAAAGDATVGVRQQLLYRYLSGHASLDDAVLAAVDQDVRPAVERIVRARQFSQARAAANPSTTPPSEVLPAWTIVDPLPADELLAEYRSAEAATGIPWYWLAAIHLQETRMGRVVGASSAGAVGPMQFLPSTWERCCTGDPTAAHDAILGAATYLAQSGGPADMHAALLEYNPSDTYVTTVTAFAENLRDDPGLYAAYHQWQVFYTTAAGTIRLPVGYSQSTPLDATAYLAGHPEDAAS